MSNSWNYTETTNRQESKKKVKGKKHPIHKGGRPGKLIVFPLYIPSGEYYIYNYYKWSCY